RVVLVHNEVVDIIHTSKVVEVDTIGTSSSLIEYHLLIRIVPVISEPQFYGKCGGVERWSVWHMEISREPAEISYLRADRGYSHGRFPRTDLSRRKGQRKAT